MAREYFCAYHSFLKSIEPLNDTERGRLFTACLQYSETGVEPELRGNERFVFPMIREQIDRDKNNYEKICNINRANGSLGGVATATERHRTPPNGGRNRQGEGKDKDKGKDKGERGTDGSEPETGSLPANNIFIKFPLNDGTEYEVTADKVRQYAELYPVVNVEQELRNMTGWCVSNPAKRKTRRGADSFINRWLAGEQDKGGTKNAGNSVSSSANAEKSQRRKSHSQLIAEAKERGELL